MKEIKQKNEAWIIPVGDFERIQIVLAGCNFLDLLRNARKIEYETEAKEEPTGQEATK